jgi:hypothetical protein
MERLTKFGSIRKNQKNLGNFGSYRKVYEILGIFGICSDFLG